MTKPTVGIAGAGIGGLTAALTLHQHGMAATVVERAQTLRPLGVGMPMVDRDVLLHWGTGPVTLLGDAAHPMYPVGANGASQAIVDARVLADELARDPVTGLRAYEHRRHRDTTDVIAATREMHAAGTERGEDIARVTTKYRNDTERSTS